MAQTTKTSYKMQNIISKRVVQMSKMAQNHSSVGNTGRLFPVIICSFIVSIAKSKFNNNFGPFIVTAQYNLIAIRPRLIISDVLERDKMHFLWRSRVRRYRTVLPNGRFVRILSTKLSISPVTEKMTEFCG